MATRMTETAQLAARVRRVGWPCVYGRDGWRITAPNGEPIILHKSYSDVNALKVVERLLNDYGFDRAERKAAAAEERIRKAKIEADRAENERAIAATVKRAKVINLAAGIYAMDEVDIGFLMKPHPAPVCRKIELTPEMAEKLLTLNTHNRPRKKRQIARLIGLIEAGKWKLTHQGIALDTTATLQDGQNRLIAIATAGKTVPIYIFVGMDPENFPYLDTHVVRSTADTLALSGIENHTAVASMMRLVYLFDTSAEWTNWQRFPLENERALKMTKQHEGLIAPSYKDGLRLTGKSGARVARGAATAGTFIIRRAQGNNPLGLEMLEEFIDVVSTGVGIRSRQDPRAVFRSVSINIAGEKGRRAAGEPLGLYLKAWNAYATGKTITSLAFRKNELMPRPVIVDNGR